MPGRIPRYQPPGPDPSRVYRAQRHRRESNAFYCSTPWRKLRAWKLGETPWCELCDAKGQNTLATHVHHVKPIRTHPTLALTYSNLQSICQPCHNALEIR